MKVRRKYSVITCTPDSGFPEEDVIQPYSGRGI